MINVVSFLLRLLPKERCWYSSKYVSGMVFIPYCRFLRQVLFVFSKWFCLFLSHLYLSFIDYIACVLLTIFCGGGYCCIPHSSVGSFFLFLEKLIKEENWFPLIYLRICCTIIITKIWKSFIKQASFCKVIQWFLGSHSNWH